jgi:hypothetical protein
LPVRYLTSGVWGFAGEAFGVADGETSTGGDRTQEGFTQTCPNPSSRYIPTPDARTDCRSDGSTGPGTRKARTLPFTSTCRSAMRQLKNRFQGT